MLLDRQNMFLYTADLAAGANNSDVLDMRAAIDLGESQVGIGHGGQTPELFIKIKGAKGNADNTIAIVLSGADDEAMSTNAVAILTVAAVNLASGAVKHWKIPGGVAKKRYYRCVCTVAGTTSSIADVDLYLHTTANQRSLAGNGLV